MKVGQLKRHLDRRLRTKADKADLRRLERRVEARLRVKASKADLRRFERQMDARLDSIDARLLEHDRRFAAIDRRLDTLLEQLGSFGRLLTTIRDQRTRILAEHETRLREVEASEKQARPAVTAGAVRAAAGS